MNEEYILNLRTRIELLENIVLKMKYDDRVKKMEVMYRHVRWAFNDYFGVNINTHERKRETVKARQMYYKYLRIHTCLSLREIGLTLDLKQDHSTLIHAIEEFDEKVVHERDYRTDWIKVTEKIKSNTYENRLDDNPITL
jgi:chromosomal replication initiation ATPase DnaA